MRSLPAQDGAGAVPWVAMATPPALKHSLAQFLPWGPEGLFHLAGCCLLGRREGRLEGERKREKELREEQVEIETGRGRNKRT